MRKITFLRFESHELNVTLRVNEIQNSTAGDDVKISFFANFNVIIHILFTYYCARAPLPTPPKKTSKKFKKHLKKKLAVIVDLGVKCLKMSVHSQQRGWISVVPKALGKYASRGFAPDLSQELAQELHK